MVNLVFHYFASPADFIEILKVTPDGDEQYEKPYRFNERS
jgi:hypothetical protein